MEVSGELYLVCDYCGGYTDYIDLGIPAEWAKLQINYTSADLCSSVLCPVCTHKVLRCLREVQEGREEVVPVKDPLVSHKIEVVIVPSHRLQNSKWRLLDIVVIKDGNIVIRL